jgi:hypothetical protein
MPLEVFERLPDQGQKGSDGASPGESEPDQDPASGLDDTENVSGDECPGSVIGRFSSPVKRHGHPAQSLSDPPGHAARSGIAFNRKDDAFKPWRCSSGERLHWMERTRGRAEPSERGEYAAIQRAAGVEHDFAAPLHPAGARQLCGGLCDSVIRRRDQNNIASQHLPGNSPEREASADCPDGGASRGSRLRHDRAHRPAQLPQAPPERTAHTPCPYNRQSRRHQR